ncbi:MAG: hypothetical protein AAFP03_08635 [Cyanobacteria bacterium J06598_3]
MVFATEFDPTDQPLRRQAESVKADKLKDAQKNTPSHAVGVVRADLNQKRETQTDFLIAQATQSQSETIAPRRYDQAALRPVGPSQGVADPSQVSSQPVGHPPAAVGDNVVPLHLNGPARRVTVDPATRTLVLPDRPNLPVGLRLLNRIQQGSTVLTSLLVTGALAVYGSTVYVDKSTNRALTQLDALQGESQELTSANEAIKQSLAEQAIRPDSGLELYEPGDVLFLAPLPRRAAKVSPEEAAVEMPRPLGY